MAEICIVDENDKVIGSAQRSEARAKGLRHRIVRIFVFNSSGKVLLQQRNLTLTDNPGKWDQSVGGHVDAGETYEQAAKRETFEELGIKVNNFKEVGYFYIERPAPGGEVKRFQKVLTCVCDDPITIDPAEVEKVEWFTIEQVKKWLDKSPQDFTVNFAKAFEHIANFNVLYNQS